MCGGCEASVCGVRERSGGRGGAHTAWVSARRACGCTGLWARGECAQGRGACVEYRVSVQNTGECAWHGISIRKVWGEGAQHERAQGWASARGVG